MKNPQRTVSTWRKHCAAITWRQSAVARWRNSILASCTTQGQGVEQDATPAALWFRCAARQGNSSAQNNLGAMYEHGEGVGIDLAQAAEWYRLGAEQGNAEAQCNLAAMYFEGRGVEQDHAKALAWYCSSAHQGNLEAQTRLSAICGAVIDSL